MKAVILAAGEGNRLRPFTETMPKVMLPVAKKPVLEYVIDSLKNTKINEIILVVGYKKEVIMEHFKDYEDIQIRYVTQDKQLGTAHALKKAKKHIKKTETFLVLSGANIIDPKSVKKLIENKSKYCVLIKETPHISRYGTVLLEKNLLKKIIEKPKQKTENYISAGLYKFPGTIFNEIENFTSKGIYSLFSVIQSIINQGEKINTIKTDLFLDIIYPWDLIHVNEIMIKKIPNTKSGTIEKGVTIKGEVSIGVDTTIYSGCYIVGPVIIGEGCEIGPNTCIFPSTVIGDNSVIKPFSEIRNSVIMNDTHIGSNSHISQSIIGRGTILRNSCSTITGEATIEKSREHIKIENIGAMIGENCTIESNVIIEPGITIGRKCNIAPLKKISKNIPSENKVM